MAAVVIGRQDNASALMLLGPSMQWKTRENSLRDTLHVMILLDVVALQVRLM